MASQSIFKIWWLTLAVKLVVAAWLPMFSDETYYWVWSENLQLSYFDHPPLIAWLIAAGSIFESLGNAVRWPAVVLGHCTLIAWYFILRPHFDIERMKNWLFLALLTPLTGFGSLLVTPDLPVIFFWSVGLLFMERALSEKDLKWYALLGVALGLGFCSKYHMALFVPLMLIWLTIRGLWRQVNWLGALSTFVLGFIFSLPVLIWNYQNEWMSFEFQLKHGFAERDWEPRYVWEYILGQIALIFPTVLYFAVRSSRSLKNLTWLPIFAWIPLAFFLTSSFKGRVEANWTIISFPPIIALALMNQFQMKWVKWTAGLWLVLGLGVGTQIAFGWMPTPPKKLHTELTEGKLLAKVAESYRPIYMSTFQHASKVWYETKTPTYKLKGVSRYDFYDSLEESKPTEKTYFFVGEWWNQLPEWARNEGHKIVNRYKMTQKYTLFEVHQP